MTNSAFFVLVDTATGCEAHFDTPDEAIDGVWLHIRDGDHWVIFKYDHDRADGEALLVTHGCLSARTPVTTS